MTHHFGKISNELMSLITHNKNFQKCQMIGIKSCNIINLNHIQQEHEVRYKATRPDRN